MSGHSHIANTASPIAGAIDSPKVYVLWPDRTDVAQGIDEMPRRRVLPFPIQRWPRTLRIPGHNAVREEGQGAGSGDERLDSPTALRG